MESPDLYQRYPVLTSCRESIEAAVQVLEETFRSGNKLLICGNGGSASDADHIAGELLKAFCHPRPITGQLREQLGGTLADKLQGGLPCIPLPDLCGLISAWSNDCDPDYVYAQLVLALGKPGDALLCLSTSGNSRNILHACDTAKALGLRTLALTGESGGSLKTKADLPVCMPASRTDQIQELHLPVYHYLCQQVETRLFDA